MELKNRYLQMCVQGLTRACSGVDGAVTSLGGSAEKMQTDALIFFYLMYNFWLCSRFPPILNGPDAMYN